MKDEYGNNFNKTLKMGTLTWDDCDDIRKHKNIKAYADKYEIARLINA